MRSILQAFWAGLRCLFQMIFLPLAPVADDRIFAAKLFERSLDVAEHRRQELRYWSVLNLLRRAARRQAKMNARGQAMFDELQQRQWDPAYAFLAGVKYLFMVSSITYGMLALQEVVLAHFPLVSPWWQAADAKLSQVLHWIVDLLPGKVD